MSAQSTNSYFNFGIGTVYGVPVAGNTAPNPTPQQWGTVQDCTLEITGKIESLMGQNKFPDDTAASDISIKGKVTFGAINPELLNQLIYGETITTSSTADITYVTNESHTITTHTVTASNTPLVEDLGVINGLTGSSFEAVASSPAIGQYSVVLSTGVYTFNSSETATVVKINYGWATQGSSLILTNRPQGYGPVCQMILTQPYAGNNSVFLYAVRFNSSKLTEKRAGYSLIETDYEAYANSAGNVLQWCYNGNALGV